MHTHPRISNRLTRWIISCLAWVLLEGGAAFAQASDAPLILEVKLDGDQLELTFDDSADLETGDRLNGNWAPLPGALSPFRVTFLDGPRFFRLRQTDGVNDPTAPDYGYDPTDLEDIPLIELPAAPTPPTFATVNLSYLPPVGRQGTTNNPGSPGSCAAWASTYGLATFMAAKNGNYSPTNAAQWASPAYLYVQVLQQDGLASNSCSGSQMTSYFSRLTAGGTPSLQSAPYTPSCTNLWANYGGSVLAPDPIFTVGDIAAVATTNLTAIQQILASNRVLAYGTRLYTKWSAYRGAQVPYVGTGIIAKQPNGKPVGHCMLIIGYDNSRQAFLIQNSEGPGWGTTVDGKPPNAEGTNAGYVWMAYSTFTKLAQGKAFYVRDP